MSLNRPGRRQRGPLRQSRNQQSCCRLWCCRRRLLGGGGRGRGGGADRRQEEGGLLSGKTVVTILTRSPSGWSNSWQRRNHIYSPFFRSFSHSFISFHLPIPTTQRSMQATTHAHEIRSAGCIRFIAGPPSFSAVACGPVVGRMFCCPRPNRDFLLPFLPF
jgi:hypothetical protein